MDIGAKIKRIRLSNQLTLEELANRPHQALQL